MKKIIDSPSRCAVCGATDTQVRRPLHDAAKRPDMRVCKDDRPCFDRYAARRDLMPVKPS